MGRRRQSSVLDDLFGIASMLPWWLSVALAIGLYFYLDSLAIMPIIDPKQPMAHVTASMVYYLAYWGRYLIPAIFVFGAIASYKAKAKRASLFNHFRQDTTSEQDAFAAISWREFEMLVGQFFREKGYKVRETENGADGGVDLHLTASDFKTYLVQCKHWKASKVPVKVVRELYGVMVAEQAAGVFLVTSGQFTDDAQAFAEGKNIQLIDGRLLVSAIKGREPQQNKPVLSSVASAIRCPICNNDMVLRTAKKGPNAGNQFYGCSGYPSCRGTRQV
ncbi:restriction endonuclease [Rheinheimera sp. UJ51]|uniref:restriction endonuclease n=1 Tax=Rheinheimera sp. UJ51 TaxID=2892446 RepID=UPI001E3EE278|nr:restriction endonuclease [Rheinheimera sp. UJ51]MCC5453369.1 restriction endonuclease [Rheinheimera sp. UJ51]